LTGFCAQGKEIHCRTAKVYHQHEDPHIPLSRCHRLGKERYSQDQPKKYIKEHSPLEPLTDGLQDVIENPCHKSE